VIASEILRSSHPEILKSHLSDPKRPPRRRRERLLAQAEDDLRTDFEDRAHLRVERERLVLARVVRGDRREPRRILQCVAVPSTITASADRSVQTTHDEFASRLRAFRDVAPVLK